MTQVYLSDLEPEEVTRRLNNGEEVFYEDSKGDFHTYKFINGVCVRWTNGEVDGYGRSIYSTCGAYFVDGKPHYTTIDPETEKLDKYLKIIIKALKEGLDK